MRNAECGKTPVENLFQSVAGRRNRPRTGDHSDAAPAGLAEAIGARVLAHAAAILPTKYARPMQSH
jgi:hypothetical protein